MNKEYLKEFRPTIVFLLKFVALYMVGNITYGAYISHFSPEVDSATHIVSAHSANILSACDFSVTYQDYKNNPSTLILENGRTMLSIYEGCNGINIMIIFVAFLVAFGPMKKTLLWFIPLGLLIIYLFNLLRIIFLFFIARHMPGFMYFTHKYLLTGMLFAVIFVLWIYWIRKYTKAPAS
jgi:exosortase family protein XrtF